MSSQTQQPAFDAIIEQRTIDTLLDTIGTVADEVIVDLNEDGLSTQVVDPANVATDAALTLQMGVDHPMKWEYSACDEELDVRMMIAPRIGK